MSRISVIVVYARARNQAVRSVELDAPSSVGAAIKASRLLEEFPEIELSRTPVGIFGKPASLDAPLRHGDQVEIYRPLATEPRESRRLRASRPGKK